MIDFLRTDRQDWPVKWFKSHSHVDTMDNDDKYYICTQGTSTLKNQKYHTGEGSWSFAGGTGKLKGLKARGPTRVRPRAIT